MFICCVYNLKAQLLRGGDIEVIKNASGLNFDFTFNLYFDADTLLDLNHIIVSYGSAIDTVDLTIQSEPKPGIRKLVFEGSHTFPGIALYEVRLLDIFPIPELINLSSNPEIITYIDLAIMGGPLYGHNALPVFENDLSESSFDDGKWRFDTSASDFEGDSLFYYFIDYTSLNTSFFNPIYPDYVFPPASDSFDINSITGEIIWDRPETIGNYLIGMTVMEFSETGFFLSKQDRFWIIEVTEEDLLTSTDSNLSRAQSTITIFPNPSNHFIKVLCENCQDHSELVIYNTQGRIIYTNPDFFISEQINTTGIPPGIYWLELRTDKELQVQSFIVK